MADRRNFLIGSGAAMLMLSARARAAAITVSPAALIFTTVEANGRAAKALVDTGSVRGLQLSEAFAKALELGLADTGRQTQRYQGGARAVLGGKLDRLAYGGVTVEGVDATVSPGDIESIGAQIGESFDAILGWPLLSKRGFVVDYPAKDWSVRDGGGAGLVLPLEVGKPLPVVAGTLSGQPVTFLVDTGAPWCNVDVSIAGGAASGSRVDMPFEIWRQALHRHLPRQGPEHHEPRARRAGGDRAPVPAAIPLRLGSRRRLNPPDFGGLIAARATRPAPTPAHRVSASFENRRFRTMPSRQYTRFFGSM